MRQEVGFLNVIWGMKASSRARKILKSFPQDVQKYFLKIDKKLQKQGYTFFLGGGKSLYNSGKCSGYFCPTSRVLAVSIGGLLEDSISTLTHEYCHYLQYKNKSSIWHSCKIYSGHQRFLNYLSGSKIYKARECTIAALLLELDCEKRAIRALKRWPKYIDINLAKKSATAYILSHWWMLENRKWPTTSIYSKKILCHCPNKFLKSYLNVPEKIAIAFKRHLR